MRVHPPVSVVCAIITRGAQVMIARRPSGKRLAGLWEFPGGKVERGERPEDALHRELREELGCEVHITKRLPSFVHDYEWGAIELIPFVCQLSPESAEPRPLEHEDLVWVERDRLATYPLAPADVPLLTAVL